MLILILALLGTATMLLRRDHALALAALLPRRCAVFSSVGIGLETIGMGVGGGLGHGLVVLGLGALIGASWSLRRWTGGWLLILGLTLNAIAIALHGRMPITPEVMRDIGLSSQIGMVLAESKDIVAAGWAATWLGDRFIMAIPLLHYTVVWSLGDLLLIGGICRAATGQVRHAQYT